jgi:hypothetical protein
VPYKNMFSLKREMRTLMADNTFLKVCKDVINLVEMEYMQADGSLNRLSFSMMDGEQIVSKNPYWGDPVWKVNVGITILASSLKRLQCYLARSPLTYPAPLDEEEDNTLYPDIAHPGNVDEQFVVPDPALVHIHYNNNFMIALSSYDASMTELNEREWWNELYAGFSFRPSDLTVNLLWLEISINTAKDHLKAIGISVDATMT